MSDTRSQLEEIDALIAESPDDPALQQLRDDLLQLIALEEQEASTEQQGVVEQPSIEANAVDNVQSSSQQQHAEVPPSQQQEEESSSVDYAVQGTFREQQQSIADAPNLGSFQPVHSSKSDGNETSSAVANLKDDTTTDTTATNTSPEKRKKKKKKSKDDAVLDAKFELPSHLVPLDSDTEAQRQKKARTAKALKSKFRNKKKEAQHAKKQNDWQSFAKSSKRKKGGMGGSSIFSIDEGVNGRVGVVSGGSGGRKMSASVKRHKFT